MANFEDIHRRQLNSASGRVRANEIWNIYLLEPVVFAKKLMTPFDERVYVVSFRATPRGNLEPASDADREKISDWTTRHRQTPDDAFKLGFLP